jgi:predicted metal-dependent HD superfamily phosphohydrolase
MSEQPLPDQPSGLDFLAAEWDRLTTLFGVPTSRSQAVFAQLAARYASSGRSYHTLDHICDVLTRIHALSGLAVNLPALQFAAWFHDIIYDTHASTNEERSAVLAGDAMKALRIPSAVIAETQRLILLTKSHQTEREDIDGQILLDADLAILGTDPPDYERYARAIWQEYAWVPEDQYKAGRRAVLQGFLRRPRIYFTEPMSAALEQSARNNLSREIETLQ